MSEFSFDSASISRHLDEVAEQHDPSGSRHIVVLVGGGLLAWHGLREATRDVDSVRRLDEELRAAVAAVAERHGLAPKWLNDHASSFAPETLRLDDCDTVLDAGRLLVLGAPPRVVFVMKLYANRAVDQFDLRALWPMCQFVSARDAAEFYAASYPALEEDPFLVDHLEVLVRSMAD